MSESHVMDESGEEDPDKRQIVGDERVGSAAPPVEPGDLDESAPADDPDLEPEEEEEEEEED